MKRRTLLVSLASGAFAPLTSFAQAPGKVWRVGIIAQSHVDFVDADLIYGPFTQGMRELGYVIGKNLVIEVRSAEGNIERLPELAAALVRLRPDVFVTQGTPAARAVQKATAVIPIVMSSGDLVGSGLVKSLARPGGNNTGLSLMAAELGPKLLEMLHSMAPKATRVAVLVNPLNASAVLGLENIRTAAQKLGVKIQPVEAETPPQIAAAFALMARQNSEALVVTQDSSYVQQKKLIADLAKKQRLPAISGFDEYVEAGGLMSYGPSIRENFRRAAIYVDKIFKGAKAGDLPVEQPMRFEMALNMKTAKALGLKVPTAILIQATKVIE